jgi:hypothetical protein
MIIRGEYTEKRRCNRVLGKIFHRTIVGIGSARYGGLSACFIAVGDKCSTRQFHNKRRTFAQF